MRFVRFDDTGARLLAGSYDATMRVYDDRHPPRHRLLQRDYQWERSACFAGDDVLVGSFGTSPVRHPLAPARGSETVAPPPPTFGINTICASGGQLYVGRDDGVVLALGPLSDPPAGGPGTARSRTIERHPTIVNAIAPSPDGAIIASADYRGGLVLSAVSSTVATGAFAATGATSAPWPVRTRTADGGPVNCVVWHPDGSSLFTAGYDGVIRQWTRTGDCVAQWTAHHGPIKSLAWSGAAALLVAGSSDGSLSAWRDGAVRWRAETEGLVLVNAVACADDDGGGTVVSVSRDRGVRRWRAATGELVETLPTVHDKSVKAVAVSADGNHMVTGSYDGTAIHWTRRDDQWHWRVLRIHGKPGVPAVLLLDGRAVTAGWDGTVAEWLQRVPARPPRRAPVRNRHVSG